MKNLVKLLTVVLGMYITPALAQTNPSNPQQVPYNSDSIYRRNTSNQNNFPDSTRVRQNNTTGNPGNNNNNNSIRSDSTNRKMQNPPQNK